MSGGVAVATAAEVDDRRAEEDEPEGEGEPRHDDAERSARPVGEPEPGPPADLVLALDVHRAESPAQPERRPPEVPPVEPGRSGSRTAGFRRSRGQGQGQGPGPGAACTWTSGGLVPRGRAGRGLGGRDSA
ncbi:hypothetical protein ABE83_08365 [Streptomyces sp. CFMR 7]|nr:hypothetical protein ABE83_08365 [Streptomyces sp. CFMR 7]